MPICKIHKIPLICPACVGTAGGKVSSDAKAEAARANGRLGGRPRKQSSRSKGEK